MTKGCTCQRAARRWSQDGICAACGERVLESQLTPVLLAILQANTGLTLWRNPVGFDERTKNHYGLIKGASDYVGLWAPTGRFVAVEMKTRRGRHEDDQKIFAALVTRRGGVYALVRSEDDARALLRRLQAEGGQQPTTTGNT